ncbi:MAG: tetratricopeptide repeat protein [Balneolaceae bacterium]
MIKNIAYILLFVVLSASAVNDARKGNEAFENGNYEEAERLYALAIEQDPENEKLYFNLGNAQAKQGKTEEAIQSYMEFRNLSESPEEKALAEFNIGTLLAESEKWQPAASHLKNSLKLNPNDPDAKFNYERAISEQKKEEDQQDDQQDQGDQEPPEPSDYAKAMKKQAEKLVAQRQYAQAYDLMMRALEADETVQAFNAFIERTKNVTDIDSN